MDGVYIIEILSKCPFKKVPQPPSKWGEKKKKTNTKKEVEKTKQNKTKHLL